jgi:hypothetical protein
VLLSWPRPSSDGGSPILNYELEYSATGVPWTRVDRASGPARTGLVADLLNTTRYRFRVRAVNDAGPGAWRVSSWFTVRAVAAAPARIR